MVSKACSGDPTPADGKHRLRPFSWLMDNQACIVLSCSGSGGPSRHTLSMSWRPAPALRRVSASFSSCDHSTLRSSVLHTPILLPLIVVGAVVGVLSVVGTTFGVSLGTYVDGSGCNVEAGVAFFNASGSWYPVFRGLVGVIELAGSGTPCPG